MHVHDAVQHYRETRAAHTLKSSNPPSAYCAPVIHIFTANLCDNGKIEASDYLCVARFKNVHGMALRFSYRDVHKKPVHHKVDIFITFAHGRLSSFLCAR